MSNCFCSCCCCIAWSCWNWTWPRSCPQSAKNKKRLALDTGSGSYLLHGLGITEPGVPSPLSARAPAATALAQKEGTGLRLRLAADKNGMATGIGLRFV